MSLTVGCGLGVGGIWDRTFCRLFPAALISRLLIEVIVQVLGVLPPRNLGLLSRVSQLSYELSCIDIEIELKQRLLDRVLLLLKIEVLVIIL